MKKTFHLLVALLAVSLLLPAAIFAEQSLTPVCPRHPEKTCFLQDRDYYCSWTENIYKSKVIRGRAGMPELVTQKVPRETLHKCAAWEHPTGL